MRPAVDSVRLPSSSCYECPIIPPVRTCSAVAVHIQQLDQVLCRIFLSGNLLAQDHARWRHVTFLQLAVRRPRTSRTTPLAKTGREGGSIFTIRTGLSGSETNVVCRGSCVFRLCEEAHQRAQYFICMAYTVGDTPRRHSSVLW